MAGTILLKRVFPVAVFFGLIGGCASTGSVVERDDCPGKIVCPQTGELICKDRCPLDASAGSDVASMGVVGDRVDCPGKMVCPQTGELICKDRCPLGASGEGQEVAVLPSCCR